MQYLIIKLVVPILIDSPTLFYPSLTFLNVVPILSSLPIHPLPLFFALSLLFPACLLHLPHLLSPPFSLLPLSL